MAASERIGPATSATWQAGGPSAAQPRLAGSSAARRSRFELSEAKYIEQSQLAAIVQAAVGHAAARSLSQPQLDPVEALADYFRKVVQGQSTGLLQYSQAVLTSRGRRELIRSFNRVLAPWIASSEWKTLQIDELYVLLRQLCPDLPRTLVEEASRLVAVDSGEISLDTIMFALQLHLVYAEDMSMWQQAFAGLAAAHLPVTMTAFCGALHSLRPPHHPDALLPHPILPLHTLRLALHDCPAAMDFSQVLRWLALHPLISQTIGVLPGPKSLQ